MTPLYYSTFVLLLGSFSHKNIHNGFLCPQISGALGEQVNDK